MVWLEVLTPNEKRRDADTYYRLADTFRESSLEKDLKLYKKKLLTFRTPTYLKIHETYNTYSDLQHTVSLYTQHHHFPTDVTTFIKSKSGSKCNALGNTLLPIPIHTDDQEISPQLCSSTKTLAIWFPPKLAWSDTIYNTNKLVSHAVFENNLFLLINRDYYVQLFFRGTQPWACIG